MMRASLASLLHAAANSLSSPKVSSLAARIERHSDNIDDYALQVAAFQPGEEDLLRGSLLTTVMSDQGRIFASSEGSSETYALSRPVNKIDVFISHNWSVPRRDKFLALSMHFNLQRAALVTVVVVAGLAVLTAVGTLPTFHFAWAVHPRGICCRMFCIPVFISAMIVRPHCERCSGDTIVFLDKTCIQQVDLDLKAKGIEKLCAFLQRSSSMVVIYTDVYLQKLWTVYEVASFLALHPVGRMVLIPTFVPHLFFRGLVCFYSSGIIALAIEVYTGFKYTNDAACVVLSYFLVLAFRSWSRAKAALNVRLATFSVHECKCSCEEDRPKVYRNIAHLMRTAGIVRREAEDEEALTAFNVYARRTLPEVAEATVGTSGLHYRHMLSISACAFGAYAVDEIAGAISSGMPSREIYANSLRWISIVVGGVPLVLVGSARLVSHCLQLKAWREWTFVAFVLIACSALLELYITGLYSLQHLGEKSDSGLVALTVYSTLPLASALAVFSNCKAVHLLRCFRSWLGALPSQREGGPLSGDIVGAATSSEVPVHSQQIHCAI